MDKKSILQWNCRGLKANNNEILILTTLSSPTVFCLQETFLKLQITLVLKIIVYIIISQTDNVSFKNYSIYIYTQGKKKLCKWVYRYFSHIF